MTLLATCATFAAVLASAPAGETVRLSGDCTAISVARDDIVIEAHEATVKGLRITGDNVRWKGGVIGAQEGEDGSGPKGYGVYIGSGADDVEVYSAEIIDARKGLVIRQASRVTIAYVTFRDLLEDGIIAAELSGGRFTMNRFLGAHPRPSTCTAADGTVTQAVPRRDCDGVWKDGHHADAIQMRNGVTDVRISWNLIVRPGQGITQMGTTGDLPLERVAVENNTIMTDGYHQITLGSDCLNCSIRWNTVFQWPGGRKRAIIREGAALRCENDVQDEAGDGDC